MTASAERCALQHDEQMIEHIRCLRRSARRGRPRTAASTASTASSPNFLAHLPEPPPRASPSKAGSPDGARSAVMVAIRDGRSAFTSAVEAHRNADGGHVGLGLADENVPKWKIEAASTAEAWPSVTPSTR